jgi:hypothetical protein
VFSYFEGDQRKTAELVAEKAKGMDVNVRLLLTRFRQREMRDSAEAAIKDLQAYLSFPESEKGSVRPVFVQSIKGLGFDNADSIVRKPIAVDPNAQSQAQQKENLSLNYKDAPPDIRRQMEELAGFKPSEAEAPQTGSETSSQPNISALPSPTAA